MGTKRVLSALAGVLLLALPALAQQPAPAGPVNTSPPPPTLNPGRFAVPFIGVILDNEEELGLSPAQVESLERLELDFTREAIRRQADLMIAYVDLAALTGQDPDTAVDMAGAETKIREIERIRGDLQLALLRASEAGKALLTAEQRSKLAALAAGEPQPAADPPDPPGDTHVPAASRDHGGSPHGGGRPPSGGGHGPRPPGHRPAPPSGHHSGGHRPTVHHRVFVGGWSTLWWDPYPYWPSPPPPVIEEPPVYIQQPPPPAYWYYCQSAGGYYPYVGSCPETWIPVPAIPSP